MIFYKYRTQFLIVNHDEHETFETDFLTMIKHRNHFSANAIFLKLFFEL